MRRDAITHKKRKRKECVRNDQNATQSLSVLARGFGVPQVGAAGWLTPAGRKASAIRNGLRFSFRNAIRFGFHFGFGNRFGFGFENAIGI